MTANERGVDAAGEAEHDGFEAAFPHVVADAEDEGFVELLFLVGGKLDRRANIFRVRRRACAVYLCDDDILREACAEG